MNGKQTCKILKEIRREIAAANDIELTIAECKFKGECKGTCPRCESEVAELERALEARRKLGKRIVIAGIAAGVVAVGAVGCEHVIDYVEDVVLDSTGGIVAPDHEFK